MIRLSQWFIMVCLWLYCICITKKSDTSITVIYHGMSDCTVSLSLRWVIHLSQWFIMVCLWLYCTKVRRLLYLFICNPITSSNVKYGRSIRIHIYIYIYSTNQSELSLPVLKPSTGCNWELLLRLVNIFKCLANDWTVKDERNVSNMCP